MPTRNDVAREAGVSPAVVSYVLNNSNYVSEEKRKAVMKAVRKLNYSPNLTARSLKSGKSKDFLLITDDIRNEMFSEISYYMEPVAFENGYSVTLMSSAQRSYDELINVIKQHSYAGVFLFSGVIPLTKTYVKKLNQLAKDGIPIVMFMFIQNSYSFDENITVIHANIRDAVCNAVDYLIEEKGIRKIAYLGDGDPITSGESQPFGDGLRVNGYLDSLKKHGIEPRLDYVMFLDQINKDQTSYLDVDGVVRNYLAFERQDRPDAFFVNSDELAAVLMRSLFNAGVVVPRDIQIISFGATLSSTITNPELTTVELPKKEIADLAIKTLLAKARNKEVEDASVVLRLIRKGSA